MTITLYKCADDPDTLNKTFSNALSKNGTPYEPVDDLNGYVILDYFSDIESYNAASITFTSGKKTKYYTITSRTPEPGQKVRVNLSCDVLKAYETEIANIEGILCRTSNNEWTNYTIQDGKAVYQSNRTTINVTLAELDYEENAVIFGAIGCEAPTDDMLDEAKRRSPFGKFGTEQPVNN